MIPIMPGGGNDTINDTRSNNQDTLRMPKAMVMSTIDNFDTSRNNQDTLGAAIMSCKR